MQEAQAEVADMAEAAEELVGVAVLTLAQADWQERPMQCLDGYVFDYGQKGAADQMRTTWEKIVQYVGTTYGQDICNELQNKTTVTIPEPAHAQAVIDRHTAREQVV